MSETEKDSPRHRRIRSFVLRTGRMTPSQQAALEQYWPSKGLEVSEGMLDMVAVFGNNNPVVLEIGFGMGDSLVAMAKAAPERNFIGVEVHTPGVGRLLATAANEGVENLRAFCHDAVEVLEECIADGSLDRVQIYFPDPWHKKKHNKRRLVQPEFVQLLRRKMRQGGVIHLATDWEHYAEHMMEVMCAAEGFANQAEPFCFSERPEYRPMTKFERRGERLGHGVWDLLFEKID
jgi:tRNA (guanine-N7-)-methyltransferase